MSVSSSSSTSSSSSSPIAMTTNIPVNSSTPIQCSKSKILLSSFSESISNTASKLFKNPFRSQQQDQSRATPSPHASPSPIVASLQPLPAKRYCYDEKPAQKLPYANKSSKKQLKRSSATTSNISSCGLASTGSTKTNTHHLSLRNIIKPIALRPNEYETYLLTTTFCNMTINPLTSSVENSSSKQQEAEESLTDFKSSTLSLPIIDITQQQQQSLKIEPKPADFSRLFQRCTSTHEAPSPYLSTSQNFIKKKRRLLDDNSVVDTRPYINLQKMKSKLVSTPTVVLATSAQQHSSDTESSLDYDCCLDEALVNNDNDDEDYDFIDEGIDSENQSAYSSTSSFYSNASSSSTSLELQQNNNSISTKMNTQQAKQQQNTTLEEVESLVSSQQQQQYIDIDLNQIENDLHDF